MTFDPHNASMDPWLVAEIGGDQHLFGFAATHAETGGKSWVRSSRLVELDEAAGRATTRSGRCYALGRRITADELDEEGGVAYELLVRRADEPRADDLIDAQWLTTCKIARHLGLAAPAREAAAVAAFIAAHRAAYGSARGFTG